MKFFGYVIFWAVLSHLGGWQYILVGVSAILVSSLLEHKTGTEPPA